MWNFSFVLPDLIILSTFIVYFFVYPRIPIKLNRTFFRILVVDFLVIFSDVFATLAIERAESFSPFIIRSLNALYFIFFLLRSFLFFVFTEDVLGIKRCSKNHIGIISNVSFIIFESIAFLNFFCDTIFSISETGAYSRAAFYNVVYVSAAFYLFLAFLSLALYYKSLSLSARFSVFAFNFVMALGYSMRFAFPKYLIMNLFTLFAIVIIFISFENPILYLAGKANAFNKKALFALFEEYDEKNPPFVLGFVINNYNEMREIYSGTQLDRGIVLICQYLAKTYPKLLRFYLHDGRFVLVGNGGDGNNQIKNEISERFKKSWSAGADVEIFLEAKFIQLVTDLSFKNPHKVAKALQGAFREAEKLDNVGIIINDETLKTIEQNTQIKRSVEKAVEENKVEMFLQPLMDAKTYKLVGAEALARIRDDEGNLIPPIKFIPIAEKNGRISLLGEQMFEKACQFIHNNDTKAMGLSWINVNLSPIQFLRSDLNNRFASILEKYDVPAEMIHLEITEESMIDYALLKKQIQTMQSIGFQFVLDDYGSGYSNVSRLKKCPFINIKLDMEVVRDYFKEPDKFLPSLVQAFKQMNFTVTAEGVENLKMVEAMRDIGCDYLQGYYFSKPIPADEFAKTYGIH